MDMDFDDIFAEPAAKPAPAASKFRPNANKPGLRKGASVPANAKQGRLKSLEPAATIDNVQNVGGLAEKESLDYILAKSKSGAVPDQVDAHVHEEGVSQSLNSDEINRPDSILESQGPTLSNMSLDIEEGLDIPVQDPLESASFGVTDDMQSEAFPGFSVIKESVTFEEDALLIGGDSHIDKETIETRVEAEVFPGLATIESFPDSTATSSIGQHRGKFIPKKMNGGSKKPDSGIHQHPVAKDDHLPDILVDFEADFVNEDPSPPSVSEDAFDYSSLMLDESTPGGQVSQPPDSEILKILSEPSHVDPGMLGNLNHKNAKGGAAVQVSFQKPMKSSNVSADSEVTKSSRPLRKCVATTHHVRESDGEAQDDLAPEPQNGEETLAQMKKGTTKSKTTRTKSEKPTRKRKNGDKDPEKPSEEQEAPKKKFAHTTQRRKRCVDKVLLQTPEEDIDFQKLCMRDIILLAEHKEKLAKKAKVPKTTPGSASTQKSVDGDDSRNKEATGSLEENETPDQATDEVQPTITLFNYQSFMNKTPTAKWSKQDTELFYEGIRQFGTDLSMIKELFPNLTRHQVKLKYKKEERQNPLRLSEAVQGRAKDHRHFELVIERLQAVARAEKESNPDDSAGGTGDGADGEGGEEEDESNAEVNEAASKPGKEKEEKETEDQEPENPDDKFETTQDQDDDEIDEDIFSSYKSEF